MKELSLCSRKHNQGKNSEAPVEAGFAPAGKRFEIIGAVDRASPFPVANLVRGELVRYHPLQGGRRQHSVANVGSIRKMTIELEIKAAKQLYLQYEAIFKGEETLVEKIEKYRAAISKTYHQMERLDVLEACSSCAGRKSGSCCFNGVEEWYDATSLLINMFMGVDLQMHREVQDGCLFVGSNGCKLIARHSFCVNYLCPDLTGFLTEAERRALAAISGEELLLGWELEQSIRVWLSG